MDYNKAIYDYIISLWEKEAISIRRFAINHNIEESTMRDIIGQGDYQISLPTLYKICESRNIPLSTFFKKAEEMQKKTKR